MAEPAPDKVVDDLAYFLNESVKRVAELEQQAKSKRMHLLWGQMGVVLRRCRGRARHEADEQRRRAKVPA